MRNLLKLLGLVLFAIAMYLNVQQVQSNNQLQSDLTMLELTEMSVMAQAEDQGGGLSQCYEGYWTCWGTFCWYYIDCGTCYPSRSLQIVDSGVCYYSGF